MYEDDYDESKHIGGHRVTGLKPRKERAEELSSDSD